MTPRCGQWMTRRRRLVASASLNRLRMCRCQAAGREDAAVGVLDPADEPARRNRRRLWVICPVLWGACSSPVIKARRLLVVMPVGQEHLAQGAGQGLDPRIAEPQGRGPPPVRVCGRVRDPVCGIAPGRMLGDLAPAPVGVVHAPCASGGGRRDRRRIGPSRMP
jgi:hypothetical protein